MYQYLENEKGYEISYAQKEITVEPLNAEDKKYLALHGDTHVVVVKSTVFLKDTTLFQYTESGWINSVLLILLEDAKKPEKRISGFFHCINVNVSYGANSSSELILWRS
ncbi:Trehalose operon transcriptional repressor [Listeria monocytogenes N53-1]|nr:Trehalose operon transcriptional repressor [Listeria monocytogenes]CCQ23802.1 Trehalose operon transcriptional repressor [Listeria monocytogenes N53-1]